MDRYIRTILTAALTVLVLLPLAGCTPKSPEEQVAEIRAQYTVEINAWRIVEPEPAAEETEAGEEAEGEAEPAADMPEEGEGEAGEMADEPEPEPQVVDVLFDLVILFKGDKALDGVTVSITQADANQQEKKLVRHYVETAKIVKGQTIQADFVLGGFVVDEGDVFAASLEPGIPADLGEFQEFQAPAP